MTLSSLQALTWGTVTGAVVSAILLASGESTWSELPLLRRNDARPPANQPTPSARKDDASRADGPRRSAPAQTLR